MARSLELDAATDDAARAMLTRACGSSRWVDRMMARRPFGRDAKMLTAARVEWFALSEPDWLEAFSHHPRIGDRAALDARFPQTHDLSAKEQSGIGIAGADVLVAGNTVFSAPNPELVIKQLKNCVN